MAQNIIVSLFKVESEGYQAITEIRQVPVTPQYVVLQMALVKRIGNKIEVRDGFNTGIREEAHSLHGGLIGSLLGVFGGPLGVLLLGSYGALLGSTAGAVDSLGDAALLEMVASKLVDGEVALIALAEEKDENVLDTCLSRFDTMTARFDAAAVAEEVEEAEELKLEEDKQALKKLRQAKLEDRKGKIEQKRAELEKEFGAYGAEQIMDAEVNFDRIYGDRFKKSAGNSRLLVSE